MSTSSPSFTLDNSIPPLSDARAAQDASSFPSHSDNGTSSVLPSLPPEITQHIIRLGLPRFSITTHRERYATLKCFALVNSTWSTLAQKELFRHVVLHDETVAKELLDVLRGCASLASVVRSVSTTYQKVSWRELESIYKIIKITEGIKELWLSNGNAQLHVDLVKVAANAPGLELLSINIFAILPIKYGAQPIFAHLQALALSEPSTVADLNTVLMARMPSLKKLRIAPFYRFAASDEEPGLAIRSLSRQLESMAVTDSPIMLRLRDWWSPMSKTQATTLSYSSLSSGNILSIPSSTTRLHLRVAWNDSVAMSSSQIVEHLGKLDTKILRNLQQLSLGNFGSLPPYRLQEEETKGREELETLCNQHDIELVFIENKYYRRFEDYWEDVVLGD